MLVTGVLIDGRYEVRSKLGRGGMAEVFRAQDRVTGQPVALKVLRDVDGRSVRRSHGEIDVLRHLHHPGVVSLRDSGSQDGAPYLVLDLVEGPSLADRLLEGPVGLEGSISVGEQLAEALAYAHAQGVVHRDLKPANILCDPAGNRVRLTDFGIARLDDATRTTLPGAFMGTAAYLAPEQLQGQVGPGVDVYALGLVVLECLTGVRCYTGTLVEAAMARLRRRPTIPADLPGWLGDTLRAMTNGDPGRRPPASAVAEAFHRRSAEPVLRSTTALEAMAADTQELPAARPDAHRSHRPLARAGAFVAAALALLAAMVLAKDPLEGARPEPASPPAAADPDLGAPSPSTTLKPTPTTQPSPTRPRSEAVAAPGAGPGDGRGQGNGRGRANGHDG